MKYYYILAFCCTSFSISQIVRVTHSISQEEQPATSHTHEHEGDRRVTTKTTIRKHSSFFLYNLETADDAHMDQNM
jgi:hypothetical protein